MNKPHPRYNNRFNRSVIALLRAVEAMQSGQSLVITRHLNGLRMHPLTPPDYEQTTPLPTLTNGPTPPDIPGT